LLFFFSSSPDRPGLYAVRGDGTELRQVAALMLEGLPSPPVPSPDGKRLAFPCRPDQARTGPQTDICLSAADGSDIRIVTQGKLPTSSIVGGEIAWAPDSRLLAFVTDLYADQTFTAVGEVYLLDADDEQLRALIPGTAGVRRGVIRWSPDGDRLAVLGTTTVGPETALEVVDVKEGARLNLAEQIEGQGSISQFAWSPDGSALAFTRPLWRSPFPSGIEGVELYSIAPDGSGLHRFPDLGDWPLRSVWSPDGRWLAVTAAPVGGGFPRLYILPVRGGEPLVLAPDLVVSDFPAWSPDSLRLAFLGAESAPDPTTFPPYALYVADVEEGEPRQLAQDLQPFPLITWSPDGRGVFFTSQDSPCIEGCPPGFLFSVPADGSASPVQLTNFRVDTFLGWQP
jgi:Tol biopolymer transport system component